MNIIPAILTNDFDELKDKIALIRGVAPMVQVDICDGKFVNSTTWPFLGGGVLDKHFVSIQNEQEGMPFWEDVDFELDLMVVDAISNFDLYSKLSPKRMIFHIEMVEDTRELAEFLEGIDPYVKDLIEFGVSKNPDTEMAKLEEVIPYVNFVQLMGIKNIGYQGEDFDERVLEDIKYLKNKYPDLEIAIDGGVNFDTAPALASAGASTLVVGSTIFNSNNIIDTVERLKEL
ncbi:MAG: hypothetical protein M3P22_00030 [bacterium]|nr:hypothetical protein [bacterium]